MKRDNLSQMLSWLIKCAPAVLFAGVLAAFLIPATADAATYYVSPGGDSTNVGTETSPWRSIQHAVDRASAGDTIKVMGDDDEATTDYFESIHVNKSLTIESYDDAGVHPRVNASRATLGSSVFSVTADSVTIRGFDICGARWDKFGFQAGICLHRVRGCTIQNNHCYSNTWLPGIFLEYSSDNTISGNTCDWNDRGITLRWSDYNTVSGNTCSGNEFGGIYLSSSSNNAVAGNTCSNCGSGISLGGSNNTVAGNTCWDNGSGISVFSHNTIYLNNSFANRSSNISSDGSNTWRSPTKLGYLYGSSEETYKSYVGNYYGDYTGSDGDHDGIGNIPYSTDGDGDRYPLIENMVNYNLQIWYLTNPVMYRGNMSMPGTTVSLDGSSSAVWVADQPTYTTISFGAGDESDSTSWTGLIAFTSPPDDGDIFTLQVGYANDRDGADFWEDGPEAVVTGHDSTTVFTYVTNAVPFAVPRGKYLALKITNNGSSNYRVRGGGSWSFVAAPEGSQDYSLKAESRIPVLRVPSEYATIQAAIDAAVYGDTVLVADGVYTGEGNKNLDSGGKVTVVMSENGPEVTIIDCEGDGRGFHFHSGEDSASMVNGFTIKNGSVGEGGGILCFHSSPVITNCIFFHNLAWGGGGIYCDNSSPVIIHNTFSHNSSPHGYGGGISCHESSPMITKNALSNNVAGRGGGGIYCGSSSPTIVHNTFSKNSAGLGGGIYCIWSSSPTIVHNTFSKNSAVDGYGGGICCRYDSSPMVCNTILWADMPDEIYLESSTITITYSDIQEGYAGEANIDADPLFVDPANEDFHLQAGSPCIDTGDPNSPLDPDGTRADMGAWYCDQSGPSRLYGDVTDNGEVTPYDAAHILQHTVGLLTLTSEDSVAAEVSGNDTISAYDASLVLQYVVGKITQFPVEEGQQAKIVYSSRRVWMGEVKKVDGEQICLPILIDNMDSVTAGEMVLSCEEDVTDVTVNSSALTSDYLIAHNVQNGRISVSFAGAESSTGPGTMLEVVFDASDAEFLSSLRLDRVSLNEGRIPVSVEISTSVEERRAAEIPSAFSLSQNHPNPFNSQTTIGYDIATASVVRLSVYALTGQLVRTLVDGERPAGSYSVAWDGRDDAGRTIGSGIYLCRMETGEYSAVRKMLLVR